MAKISVILLICATLVASVHSIGVNYGTNGDNLPPPAQVAQFLKDKTNIDRVKIFDVRPDILRGFADTGISLTVTVPNGEINAMVNLDYAKKWVEANIKPFYPQTKISYICMGNEIVFFDTQRENLLLPAMQTLYEALVRSNLGDIKVTTPHSLVILEPSPVPSAGKFKPVYEQSIIAPMLRFLRDTKSAFMVNPYPYFGYSPEQDSFALFKSNQPLVHDTVTNQGYTNMFDMQLDTIYFAMKGLGFGDVEIVVGEVGWPSQGENKWANVENAETFNGGLVRKYNNAEGTPLMPKKRIETYIFALFNENLKGGNVAEKNFGLFRPDFTPVYNAGILKDSPQQAGPTPAVPRSNDGGAPVPQQQGKKWCVPKPDTTDAQLQANLDWACGQGIDCKQIQPGGACFDPNNVRSHATFAMNAYYQAKGLNDFNCDFTKSGLVSITDPSYGSCVHQGGSAPEVQQGKKWCLPKSDASDKHLQANIDWVCGQGIDCKPIQAVGACFEPNNVRSHAAYAMNAFFQSKGKIECGFDNSGFISISDPSYGSCVYQG